MRVNKIELLMRIATGKEMKGKRFFYVTSRPQEISGLCGFVVRQLVSKNIKFNVIEGDNSRTIEFRAGGLMKFMSVDEYKKILGSKIEPDGLGLFVPDYERTAEGLLWLIEATNVMERNVFILTDEGGQNEQVHYPATYRSNSRNRTRVSGGKRRHQSVQDVGDNR